ncbi:MAG TPA: viral A-type inclusion protein [Rickettsia endosymbiont of Bembidion nr. Transversale]|nr:viral A-type inclusion protein [Rickettsia endosymbiont of Bembidion nr. Transversale]
MKKESNNQNQDLEEKQNIVEIKDNTSNAANSAESSQFTTSINVEPNIDDDAVNKLKNQLSFSTKALEKQQQELSKVLSSSAEQLNDAVKTFNKTIIAQKTQYAILQNEVGVLTVLPEKTKEAVTNIIPDVAKELDKIQREYTKSLHDSYSTIISGYAEEIQKYKTEIDQISHDVTSHITKHMSSVDQKLDEYSKKLSASAAYVVECSNYSFLKNMCLVVLFSAIVAGGTAYLVTTKFPRYLTVTGANDVTIQDCNVSVLGKAKDPDNLMDKMTKKK